MYDKISEEIFVEFFREIKAPRMIIPDMALDTLISGEWSEGVTPQIIKYPTKQANENIINKVQISVIVVLFG